MLSSKEKSAYRAELFRHLDGIAIAPVIYALKKQGVLDFLMKKNQVTLSELNESFDGNEGYLNIGLRMIASQGWLEYEVDAKSNSVDLSTNKRSPIAFQRAKQYREVVDFMKISTEFHPRHFEREQFTALNRILNKYKSGEYDPTSEETAAREVEYQIQKHIEGVLVGPITVMLGMDGMFHKYFMEASFSADEFHEDPVSFSKILDFFTHLEWFSKNNEHYRFTNKGLFFARRSTAYGVTVSYIPTFRRVDELMFGNALIFKSSSSSVSEIHVDREMNVWGSGGAHSAYFKKIDDIIISLFNKPIEEQPKGILDMGCGNGAFLIHLFEVIEQRTHRGTLLEEYPLFLVGVDYNRAALKVTRANLVKADIWAKVIWGDIGNPEQLEKDIQESYDIELNDLLNVRTFLDHNRPWSDPENTEAKAISTSTGAFSDSGKRLHNAAVEQNLREHFENWKRFIGKFGLLLIELHTIDSSIAAQNIGKTAATAYDATHGFSDQYILELDVFSRILADVGLRSDPAHFSKFPNNELATVSIHYLTVNN
ncbi:class I SAM-dependent methyltransferase [Aureitalea sp. L0-47]|uniref:class I SAM-dependent methyltransferase n=1 Tax=Aureitalea sp. L0-47 TaxID=2816962 RepID=UPI002238E04D|nr:class I SAM-dependent methyltransferase [Aureitalea sp. L0-47]MCW5520968.1 class I SAM-dependent methyltransferase [Aureitalea sp. L0-47]